MLGRLQFYSTFVLLAIISFLALYCKVLMTDLKQYEDLEKKEIIKTKITKKYVYKIQKGFIPSNDDDFERMLTKIFAE